MVKTHRFTLLHLQKSVRYQEKNDAVYNEAGICRHAALDEFGLEERDADGIVHELECGRARENDKHQGAGQRKL